MDSRRRKTLYYQLLNGNKYTPLKAYSGSAGYDLFIPNDVVIPRGKSIKIPLDIKFEIPRNCYGRIALRSSWAMTEINVRAGVIDNDYRGNVFAVLHNDSLTNDFEIKQGDRVVQLILEKYQNTDIEEREIFELSADQSNEMKMSSSKNFAEATAAAVTTTTKVEAAAAVAAAPTFLRKRGVRGFGSSGLNEVLI